jgi:hypothetical protein
MFVTQLRTAAAIVVTATFAGISTGVFAYHQFNGTVPSADPVGAKQNSNKVAAAVAAPADPSKKADSQDDAAALQRSAKNLHKLALAMHDYLQVTGRLPAAAVFDSDGKPLLSWRVLLLPYIGEKRLFAEFHLDEAWDSPHNRKLLAKMPRRYAPVNGKTRQPFATYYQVFVGKGAAFEGTRGLRVFDFTDGTSNTFLIAEAGEAVPWTKPADLPFAPNAPLPKLGGQFADGFHAALADGSVCLLRKDWNAAEEKAIRVVIGRNDGMVVPKEFEGLVRKPSK